MIPGFFASAAMSEAAPVSTPWYDRVFLPGDEGMAFDFNDLGSVFQDSAGTVPAASAGDPISSVRCQMTNELATIQGSHSCVLRYDAGRQKHYAEVGSTTTGDVPLFRASGALPTGLLGDSPLSLIAVAEFDPTQTSLVTYIGPPTPAFGALATVGHYPDPGLVLDFLQWGSGRGLQSPVVSGARAVVAVKGVRAGTNAPAQIFVDGSLHGAGVFNNPSVNITVRNFDIARITQSGRRIYTVGAINRPLSAAEAAEVFSASL